MEAQERSGQSHCAGGRAGRRRMIVLDSSRGMRRSSLVLSSLVLAVAVLAACRWERAEPLSPGEVAASQPSLEQLTGEGNPAQRAIAVVLNRRGEVLTSFFRRIAGAPAPADSVQPSGGKRPLAQSECEKILEEVQKRSGRSPLHVRRNSFETVRQGQEALYGLRWTLPGGERQGNESALDNALRVIGEQTGAPRRLLKQERFFFDEKTQTAYFRFRYQGHPKDTFLFYDPALRRGESFQAQSVWAKRSWPEVQLLMAYVELADGLDAKTTARLFGLK